MQHFLHIANHACAAGKVYHVANPEPITLEQFFVYLQNRGYPIEFVNSECWLNACLEQLKYLSDKNKSMVLAKYFDRTSYGRGIDTYFNAYQFVQNNVKTMLSQTEIKYPMFYQKLLDTYFDFFESTGFIAASTEGMTCE